MLSTRDCTGSYAIRRPTPPANGPPIGGDVPLHPLTNNGWSVDQVRPSTAKHLYPMKKKAEAMIR